MMLVDKYRPRRLQDFIGQKQIIERVSTFIKSDKIPHTILITGAPGFGKTSLALTIAYLINRVKYKVNSDHWYTLPDLQDHNIGEERGIDAIREIIHTANYAPQRRYRVILLDELAKATSQGISSLLKPLENAHLPKTVWILVTNEPERLPITIMRRCYPLHLQAPTTKEIIGLLNKITEKEQFEFPQQDKLFKHIATSCQNMPALAIQMLQVAADSTMIGSSYKEILSNIVTNIPSMAADRLAVKCLVLIYRDQQGPLWQGMQQQSVDTIALINALLNFNSWLISWKSGNTRWQSPMTSKLKQHLEELKLPVAIELQNRLLDLRGEAQSFVQNNSYLMPARLTKLVTDLRRINRK